MNPEDVIHPAAYKMNEMITRNKECVGVSRNQ